MIGLISVAQPNNDVIVSLLYIYKAQLFDINIEGQNYTSVLLEKDVICSTLCLPDYDCSAGQVRYFCFS